MLIWGLQDDDFTTTIVNVVASDDGVRLVFRMSLAGVAPLVACWGGQGGHRVDLMVDPERAYLRWTPSRYPVSYDTLFMSFVIRGAP